MGLTLWFSTRAVLLGALCFAGISRGQEASPPPRQTQPTTQQPSVQPPTAITSGESTAATVANVKQPQKPPDEPYILEDGGFSIEPLYWLTRAQPTLLTGKTGTGVTGLDYPGNSNSGIGGELAFPAGRSNSLRLSYFRVQGNANTTATQTLNLFGEGYVAGDYLNASYRLQNAKISWDYLSYTWHNHANLRLKTLWEIQYTTISTGIYAPFKAVTTDSSGNTDNNFASGSRNLIYPTFGMELEQPLKKHFRWEAKASGFGVPHRGDIWDAEASIAVRFGSYEFLGGEKAYHFKTSPQGDQYFSQTLSGAYIGLRYYWGNKE